MYHKAINKLAVLLISFAVSFTMMPAMADSMTSSAVAPYWRDLHAKETGQANAQISWKKLTGKQQKKIHGIAVFRDGKPVKTLSRKAASFSDSGLKEGMTYTYRLKTFKRIIKRTRMWYNRTTGEYQKKKPAKKYRGRRKTLKNVVYKYGNDSPVMKVTAGRLVPAEETAQASPANPSPDAPGDPTDIRGKMAELDKKLADIDRRITAKEFAKDVAERELAAAQTAYGNVGREFIDSSSAGMMITRPRSGAKEAGRSIGSFVAHCRTDDYLSSKVKLDSSFYQDLEYRLSVQDIRESIRDIRDMNAFRISEGAGPLNVSYELMAYAAVSGTASGHLTVRNPHAYWGHQPWPESAGSEMIADSCGLSDIGENWIAETLLQEKDSVRNGTIDLYATHYRDAIDKKWRSIGISFISKAGRHCVSYSESAGSVDIDTYEREFNAFVKNTETRYTNAKNEVSALSSEIDSLSRERSSLESQRNELAMQL